MTDRSVFVFSRSSIARAVARRRATGCVALLLGLLLVALSGSQSACGISCKPIVTVEGVRFSEAQSLRRVWTAVLAVDSSYCATSFGQFEIDFVRLKENAPDLQFTKQLTWRPGRIEVSVEFWADESVHDYRIGFIAPCVCSDLPSNAAKPIVTGSSGSPP